MPSTLDFLVQAENCEQLDVLIVPVDMVCPCNSVLPSLRNCHNVPVLQQA
jgi:hypothetical protein